MNLVLVINAGSSSLKYALVDPETGDRAAGGVVEQIVEVTSTITHDAAGDLPEVVIERAVADHGQALREVQARVAAVAPTPPVAVGHRVVHGGDRFSEPVIIDDEVIAAIEDCVPLAPLHNPACLSGIRAGQAAFPDVPQVAVFDTAFHATMPPSSKEYALDRALAEEFRLRRYGFHGTSHQYVSKRAAKFLGKPATEMNTVTLHLGNGASACAVRHGRSIDTSMGVTPLEGLVMGTRCGDIDPSIPAMLMRAGKDAEEVDAALNRQSGLLGVAGVNDMREVAALADSGDENAELARQLVVHRIKKYLGAYAFELGSLDAVVFTAGIGEHDKWTRSHSCEGLEAFGISVDESRNADVDLSETGVARISPDDSPVAVLVVATDEEHAIAQQAWELVG